MEVRPTYLIMVTTANNNKYYNCFPEGDRFRVEYGRVDATKTTAYYPMSKWNSQISSKLKKGYQDVTDLKKDLVEEVSSANPESPYKEIENAAVRAEIGQKGCKGNVQCGRKPQIYLFLYTLATADLPYTHYTRKSEEYGKHHGG